MRCFSCGASWCDRAEEGQVQTLLRLSAARRSTSPPVLLVGVVRPGCVIPDSSYLSGGTVGSGMASDLQSHPLGLWASRRAA